MDTVGQELESSAAVENGAAARATGTVRASTSYLDRGVWHMSIWTASGLCPCTCSTLVLGCMHGFELPDD